MFLVAPFLAKLFQGLAEYFAAKVAEDMVEAVEKEVGEPKEKQG